MSVHGLNFLSKNFKAWITTIQGAISMCTGSAAKIDFEI